MSRCVIISGGDFCPVANLRADDFIIACDRGYEYARLLGVTPDLIIGDFDSYPGELPEDIPTQTLPCEKDDTDTMHAVKYAVDKGFDEILLICALGGRLDHLLANIQSCLYAIRRGVGAAITDRTTDIRFLQKGSLTLPAVENSSLSLLSASEKCTGVCISGVKYPLDKAELLYSHPLGVSNEWTGDQAKISVESGILMIVMSKK